MVSRPEMESAPVEESIVDMNFSFMKSYRLNERIIRETKPHGSFVGNTGTDPALDRIEQIRRINRF